MRTLVFVLLLIPATWVGYGEWLTSKIAPVQLAYVDSQPINEEKTLPFYEVMSPLPSLKKFKAIPKLEYKKGPPQRYIERISVLINSDNVYAKERIVYYGRRSDFAFPLVEFFSKDENREAKYLESALKISQGGQLKLPFLKKLLFKPLLLQTAKNWLENVEQVDIMEQSGVPAFFFQYREGLKGENKSSVYFVRRSSFYQVDYLSEGNFEILNPLDHFRKSFLVEKRADALQFLANNLSRVHMKEQEMKTLTLKEIIWPILLLAANVSIDPSSLDAYFHFAGISALLYRSSSLDRSDSETLDVLRNNVLVSEFYAKDVSPKADQTREIGRLSRLLQRIE